VHCAGSASIQPDVKEERKEAAEEGTAAHWVLEQFIINKHMPEVNAQAPNGVLVTDEMQVYAQRLLGIIGDKVEIVPEMQVETSKLGHGIQDGTADMHWVPQTETNVLDYKFGHAPVEVIGNTQLLIYAWGVAERYNMHATDHPINLHIYQPRASHIRGTFRTWTITRKELNERIGLIQRAAANCQVPNPLYTAGVHCKYCPGMAGCAAFREATENVLNAESSLAPAKTPEEIAMSIKILRLASGRIYQRLAALEAVATEMISSNKPIPGFMIQPGRGKTKFSMPVDKLKSMGDMLGVKLTKSKESAITMAQFEKLGLPDEVRQSLLTQESGAPKLVLNDESYLKEIFKNDT
jgi:hypothetical protein